MPLNDNGIKDNRALYSTGNLQAYLTANEDELTEMCHSLSQCRSFLVTNRETRHIPSAERSFEMAFCLIDKTSLEE